MSSARARRSSSSTVVHATPAIGGDAVTARESASGRARGCRGGKGLLIRKGTGRRRCGPRSGFGPAAMRTRGSTEGSSGTGRQSD
jgi:hypothetical protein